MELFSESQEECQQVASALDELGCCGKCVLRFLGESKPSTYRETSSQTLNKILPDKTESTSPDSESSCRGCLGILQKYADDSFINKIKEKVRKDNFDFTHYQCSLTLPVSIAIRQKAIFVHLKNKFGDMYTVKESKIPAVKEVWKWSCGFRVGELLGAQFQNKSDFDILMNFNYPDSEKECNFLLDTFPNIFRKRKQRKYGFETFTRANVAKALDDMTDTKFESCSPCPPPVPSKECMCEIECTHDAVFVAGRYNKYSRVLSQTPWLVDGERVMEGSVEELICEQILKAFRPTDHRLSSSGREDVDVRMLGIGRPFIVELINPHCVVFTKERLAEIQQETNNSSKDIRVRDLQIISRDDTNILKQGETDKTKTYSAECWCERLLTDDDLRKLSEYKDLVLQQKTPLRVLHRRTVATREKIIHSLRAEVLDRNMFKLYLQTQAGTYIKEFVHGDFGRTTPSLSEILGADCDILNLDVESVDVDWPPRIDDISESSAPLSNTTDAKTSEEMLIDGEETVT